MMSIKENKYNNTLSQIKYYYGVSEQCSVYLYHRALRSKKKDNRYMPWYLQLQNAIVKLDKCNNVDWENIIFGKEYITLEKNNIILSNMSKTVVFKWTEDVDNGWNIVTSKKKRKNNITNIGLFI